MPVTSSSVMMARSCGSVSMPPLAMAASAMLKPPDANPVIRRHVGAHHQVEKRSANPGSMQVLLAQLQRRKRSNADVTAA
jgi:hypothetical protein